MLPRPLTISDPSPYTDGRLPGRPRRVERDRRWEGLPRLRDHPSLWRTPKAAASTATTLAWVWDGAAARVLASRPPPWNPRALDGGGARVCRRLLSRHWDLFVREGEREFEGACRYMGFTCLGRSQEASLCTATRLAAYLYRFVPVLGSTEEERDGSGSRQPHARAHKTPSSGIRSEQHQSGGGRVPPINRADWTPPPAPFLLPLCRACSRSIMG